MPLIHQKFRHTNFIVDDPQKCCGTISIKSKSDRIIIVTSPNSKLNSLIDKTSETKICIQPSEINRYLGQEFDCILFDLSEQFNVNAFTAICGCLVGGGELILNLPTSSDSICPLLTRFIQEIKKTNNEKSPKTSTNDDFFIEQEQLIEKIKRCALGHAKRPLVITANRGRGKSATLGIAAGQLVKEKNKKIIITAPRKSNLNVFFQYVKRQTNDDKQISFVPPDRLIKEKKNADLVIIDEAGAIPVQILEKIINTYNRMVFSTTTDGYEGNGQGFKIRFQNKLKKHFPQSPSATLNNPMRWASGDPLETALNKAFMLSFEKDKSEDNSPPRIDNTHYQFVPKSKLLSDEKLLKQIYTLLVEAHYQTRPSDLQRILTDTSMQVFIAFNKEQDKKVIATALVCVEGKLNEEDSIQIEKGQKRLAGHLLPQSLMAYQGDIDAGKLSYWRIMRIAVRPEFQRKRLGSQLLEYIEEQAKESSIQILGASFALTQPIVQFWYQSGFKCTRLALTKDSSTGSYPGEFMKPINFPKNDQNNSYFKAIAKFQQSFFYSLTSSYLNIDSGVLLSILDFQIEGDCEKLADNIISEILRYVEKARSYEMVEWQINQLVSVYLTNKIDSNLNSELTKRMLLEKSLQNKNWQTMVSEFEFDGKKVAKERVRKAIETLIRSYKPK